MTAYEIISKKREGKELTAREIQYFITEFLKDHIKDYQMAAFLMAVFFRGMTEDEILALTDSYLHSGKILDLSDIPGKKIDKHSTGGVGDKVSIVLAPLAASLGVVVPMISGRGLGHTGGTLDKLESIPGFQVTGPLSRYKRQLKSIGVAMFGQSASIVPADRRIYALRDVTATVDSIPLVTASIMSKKMAEGIDGLVLDVKTGNGAVFPEPAKAEQLARHLIQVGRSFGKEVTAFLTAMDQPLGNKIGNWLEIEECIDCLKGEGPSDLRELVLELASAMLVMAQVSPDHTRARGACQEALRDGRAWEKLLEMVRWQGGDITVVEHPEKYPAARFRQTIQAARGGFIGGFDTRELGLISGSLGAGRLSAEDRIDPSAGMVLFKKVGDRVEKGDPILELHGHQKSLLETARSRGQRAVVISEQKPVGMDLLVKRIV